MMGAWLGAWPLAAHAADYLANAQASLKKGDLKSAQIDLRNAVRSDPQNAEAHYLLGRISFELGDPIAAEREAQAARDRGYDPHKTVPLLTQALLSQNKFDDLLDRVKPEGKDATLDASILVSRGYAQIGLKHSEEAQKSFAEAEQIAPNSVEPLLADSRLAVARGDLNAAQDRIDRAIAAQPKSAEALLAKAQLLRLKGDVPAALAVLDALIVDQPSIIQARLDRANLEIAAGKTDAAQNDIAMVLKATPGNVQAIYLTAVLEAQNRNYKAADADLDRISGYIPRIQRGYYLQAVVKEQLGQYAQAEDAARKYLARSPNDLAAYKVLARIQFANHRPDQVIDTLAKVTESGRADAEAYDLIGRGYAAVGRGPDAIEAFQKAQALAPNDVGVQTRLASVRMGMGDAETAVGNLEHTLQLAPKLPAVGEALFFAALATGDTSKAADALDKIRAAQGDNEIVGNLNGLLKMANLDFDGAKTTFADLMKKYPDFLPAKINLARVYLMEGNRTEAEALLQQVLSKQPAADPALTIMVNSYVAANNLDQAIALTEKAHASNPDLVRVIVSLGDLYIRAGQPQKALDLANGEKGANATNNDILSLKAAALLALGQRKEAREVYAIIMKQDPFVVGARRQLVALLIEAGEFENARAVLQTGIAADPRNYTLYQDLALVDLKSTGVDAALATADRLQSQDREFPAVRALRGDVYMAVNRPGDGAAAYKEAFNKAPSSLLVARLGNALLRSGQPQEASRQLLEWLGQHPEDMTVTEQVAEIAINQHNLDEAERFLQAVLKQKPHDPVALNNLAWVFQQQGKEKEALVLARQAYILSPTPQTADTLGWILTTSGQPLAAVPVLRQAVGSAASADPRIVFHYAIALRNTGNAQEAKKALEIVANSKGDFSEKLDAQKLLDGMTKGG